MQSAVKYGTVRAKKSRKRQKSAKWAELSCGKSDFVTELEYHTMPFLSRFERWSDIPFSVVISGFAGGGMFLLMVDSVICAYKKVHKIKLYNLVTNFNYS